MYWVMLVLPAFLIWLTILLLPWRPWSTRESLEANPATGFDPEKLTVLIPARNEADVIGHTLSALSQQDINLKVVVVDDQSTDNTAEIAGKSPLTNLKIVTGQPLPADWSGKLWALEQGIKQIDSEYILLLDADILLMPGTIPVLLDKLENENRDMVSLMAFLRMEGFWEKLLIPAFIYFFKLLYPFHLSNSENPRVAAAAGGCILIRRSVLESIGNFNSFKECLIDDCALAKKIKENNGKTWIGLTHSAISFRKYHSLKSIWETVARTAYTQLQHSLLLVLVCSILMIFAFIIPVIGLFSPVYWIQGTAIITLLMMFLSFLPTIKYYSLNPLWGCWLWFIGAIYLAMTWTSVYRHFFTGGTVWKQRQYTTPG